MRLLFSALHTVDGSGDTAFCQALLDRAREFYAEVKANCVGTAPESRSQMLRMGGNIASANLTKMVRPSYPTVTKIHGITGTVHFEAIIGQDGKIHDLELLGGPFALYDEARSAVLKWEYRPTRLNGKPIDIITTIDVNFMLNR